MPSFFHRGNNAAGAPAVEKPAPVHSSNFAHGPNDPRPSTATATTAVGGASPHVGGHHHGGKTTTTAPAMGGAGGRAFIYQRPTFGEWVKLYWVDLLTMAALGAVGLGVYEADPAPTRSFPISFQDGEIIYPQFAYPLRKEIIPIYAAALIAFFVPFIVFCITQIRVRSFDDLNTATFGVLYSLICAAVFQVFIKWLIGGLRPHFLAVCKPAIDAATIGSGYQQIMFTRSVCTGDRDEINDSLESMPSGHSTAAWAGLLFLSLYLNGKLKLFSDYRPQFWKMIAFFAPLLGAFLISGALTIDEYHNWYDLVVGGFIGSFCALASYRMSYASVWDFRFNHLPLPRTPPLASHSTWAYSTARFPYDVSFLAPQNNVGIQPWAGQWRGQNAAFEGAGGAPGDALKRGAGSSGFGGGYGGAGTGQMV
ncbi:hypothetical protein JCM6882_006872 [Rhodosporidiobolus microsporus]